MLTRWNRMLVLCASSVIATACSAGNGSHNGDGGGNHDGVTTGDGSNTGTDGSGSDIAQQRDSTVGNDGTGSDGTSTGSDARPDYMSIPYDAGITTLPDGEMVFPDGAPVPDGWTPPVGPDGGTGCITNEICGDGVDNNCNGQIDENCPCLPGQTQQCYGGIPAQAGVGVCNLGTQMCSNTGEFGTWGTCTGWGAPQPVMCGGMMDYRCDGIIDEGCGCRAGATQSCYDGPSGTEGVGLCHGGMQTCVAADGGTAWGPCQGEVTPTPELCDGMDHDCNGVASNGCTCVVGTSRACYTGPSGTEGVGLCHGGAQTCMAGSGGTGASWGACAGEVLPAADTCDGIDRACNGMPLAGCPCTIGMTQPCYTGPSGTNNVGICHGGTQSCVAMGSSAGWDSTCSGQVTPNATEICGNMLDDNCNGQVDEGCGGMIMCPPDQTTPAGTAISLTAVGTGLSNYNWTITSAPTGGIGTTNQWNASPPNQMSETFLPYIVGVYTIQVTATDSTGATRSCNFNVTAQGHGLRVELTWNGSGDLDLHLHNGNTSSPWYTSDDCYYGNCDIYGGSTPILDWDAPGIGNDDPALDFDNVTMNGPENTRIDTPVIGETYTVGVHDYANANGRTATIQIFCGGVTTPQLMLSHSVSGNGPGNCTSDTFWKVANVTFTDPTTCTINTINSTEPSSSACSSF